VIHGSLVTYTIKRSLRRRTISLRVDESGLRVGAPLTASQRAVEKVLHEHGAWVLGKLREWSQRASPAIQWLDGEELMLLGQPLRLCRVDGAVPVEIHDGLLLAPGADTQRHVIGALRAMALTCFTERVQHYCSALRVAQPAVRLSSARTRWGSCHIEGRILLNWRIIQMPLALIDYVVAHEVAHLREMNHSPRFWAAVGRLVPDYAARRKAIRVEGHRYLVV
jgi:predicted metal-dependent hydrolase